MTYRASLPEMLFILSYFLLTFRGFSHKLVAKLLAFTRKDKRRFNFHRSDAMLGITINHHWFIRVQGIASLQTGGQPPSIHQHRTRCNQLADFFAVLGFSFGF